MSGQTSGRRIPSATGDAGIGKSAKSRARRAAGEPRSNVAAVSAAIAKFDQERVGDRPDLVQLALTLAKSLDDGMGLATAGVSKELRATMEMLERGRDDAGDSFDDEFRRWMQSEVGD